MFNEMLQRLKTRCAIRTGATPHWSALLKMCISSRQSARLRPVFAPLTARNKTKINEQQQQQQQQQQQLCESARAELLVVVEAKPPRQIPARRSSCRSVCAGATSGNAHSTRGDNFLVRTPRESRSASPALTTNAVIKLRARPGAARCEF